MNSALYFDSMFSTFRFFFQILCIKNLLSRNKLSVLMFSKQRAQSSQGSRKPDVDRSKVREQNWNSRFWMTAMPKYDPLADRHCGAYRAVIARRQQNLIRGEGAGYVAKTHHKSILQFVRENLKNICSKN